MLDMSIRPKSTASRGQRSRNRMARQPARMADRHDPQPVAQNRVYQLAIAAPPPPTVLCRFDSRHADLARERASNLQIAGVFEELVAGSR